MDTKYEAKVNAQTEFQCQTRICPTELNLPKPNRTKTKSQFSPKLTPNI